MIKLKIDPEFRDLIPPLTDDEFQQLRENILEDYEVREPLVTWNDIILDGHNRWKIIQENPDIPFKTMEMIFFSRNEAILWIINNQLGRRNLNKGDAILLGQRKAAITAAEAKAKQRAAGGDKRSETYKETASVKNDKTDSEPIDTRKEVAKYAGVSTGTVAQFEQIQKKAPELVDKIRKGEMTIGGAYKEVKKTAQKEQEEKPIVSEPPYVPPPYTIDNLISEVNAGADNYIRFLRQTLVNRSTLYSDVENRKRVHDTVSDLKHKIEEIENLLK